MKLFLNIKPLHILGVSLSICATLSKIIKHLNFEYNLLEPNILLLFYNKPGCPEWGRCHHSHGRCDILSV